MEQLCLIEWELLFGYRNLMCQNSIFCWAFNFMHLIFSGLCQTWRFLRYFSSSEVSVISLLWKLIHCRTRIYILFLHWLNPKRKSCCCEKQSLGLVMFLLSSLKLFMLDHEQPTSSPAYPGAEACGETIILRLPSQCLSRIAWFYQSAFSAGETATRDSSSSRSEQVSRHLTVLDQQQANFRFVVPRLELILVGNVKFGRWRCYFCCGLLDDIKQLVLLCASVSLWELGNWLWMKSPVK